MLQEVKSHQKKKKEEVGGVFKILEALRIVHRHSTQIQSEEKKVELIEAFSEP